MSRAAVRAKKAQKKPYDKAAGNERFFARAAFSQATDCAVVTCDSCGLLQTTGASFRVAEDGRVRLMHPAHSGGCFLCGNEVGSSA